MMRAMDKIEQLKAEQKAISNTIGWIAGIKEKYIVSAHMQEAYTAVHRTLLNRYNLIDSELLKLEIEVECE